MPTIMYVVYTYHSPSRPEVWQVPNLISHMYMHLCTCAGNDTSVANASLRSEDLSFSEALSRRPQVSPTALFLNSRSQFIRGWPSRLVV